LTNGGVGGFPAKIRRFRAARSIDTVELFYRNKIAPDKSRRVPVPGRAKRNNKMLSVH
jgi:hypothetical protein